MHEKDDFESMILEILKTRPVSSETISAITGLPTNKVLMKLRRLKKWKAVEPVTKRTVIIWGFPRDNPIGDARKHSRR